jgi:hypothetical protein
MHKRVPTGGVSSDLWSGCPQGDRSHRADVDARSAVLARGHRFLVHAIEADHRVKTSFGEIHLGPAFFCSAHPNAPAAQNAPVGVIIDEGMIVHNGGFFEVMLKALWFQTHAKEFGHVLERTLLVGRAVSAIHVMNREQKPKGASLQAPYGRGVGFDKERRGDSNGAGRNRFSVDFNETQSAGGIRMPHALKKTEVWNIYAMTQTGLEQQGSLLDFQLFIVNNQFDHLVLI